MMDFQMIPIRIKTDIIHIIYTIYLNYSFTNFTKIIFFYKLYFFKYKKKNYYNYK